MIIFINIINAADIVLIAVRGVSGSEGLPKFTSKCVRPSLYVEFNSDEFNSH